MYVGNPMRLASGTNRAMLMPDGRFSHAPVGCAGWVINPVHGEHSKPGNSPLRPQALLRTLP